MCLCWWGRGGGYAYVLIDMISDCPLVSRYYCLLFYTDNKQFLQWHGLYAYLYNNSSPILDVNGHPDKEGNQIYFPSSQPKPTLWVLKRIISLRWFFLRTQKLCFD